MTEFGLFINLHYPSLLFLSPTASTATSNYLNTITSMKRLIGLKFSSPLAQAELSRCAFKAVENPDNGGVAVDVDYDGGRKVVPIETATAMMISHMSSIASAANSNVTPQDWVIAVPSFYSDYQKRSFLDACEVVGVNCLRLMHESTASALAYGIFKDIKKEVRKVPPLWLTDSWLVLSYPLCFSSLSPHP